MVVAVRVAEADLDECVLIRLVWTVMHWIIDESDNVRDEYMMMKLFTHTFLAMVFTVNPATLDLADVHG